MSTAAQSAAREPQPGCGSSPLDSLPARTRIRLLEGDQSGKYGIGRNAITGLHESQRHRLGAALVGGMVSGGWPLDMVLRVFGSNQYEGVRQVTQNDPRWQGYRLFTRVEGWYVKAVARQGEHATVVDGLRAVAIEAWPYGGQHGAWLRVVLGLYELAEQACSLTFTASLRQISEAAGVGGVCHGQWAVGTDKKTVRSALKGLGAAGWFASVPPSEMCFTYKFTLTDASRLRLVLSLSSPPTIGGLGVGLGGRPRQASRYLLHPCWEQGGGGLGPVVGRISWAVRCAGSDGITEADVAATLCMSISAVNRGVHRLVEHRVVERAEVKGAVVTALVRDLDELADDLGVSERPARRKMLNELARQAHRQEQSGYRQERREFAARRVTAAAYDGLVRSGTRTQKLAKVIALLRKQDPRTVQASVMAGEEAEWPEDGRRFLLWPDGADDTLVRLLEPCAPLSERCTRGSRVR